MESDFSFHYGDFLSLKSDIGYDDVQSRYISQSYFDKLRASKVIEVLDVHDETMCIRCLMPLEKSSILMDIERARAVNIFQIDHDKEFKTGDLVKFNGYCLNSVIASYSFLPVEEVEDMIASPSPYKIVKYSKVNKSVIKVMYFTKGGESKNYWIWRGCLSGLPNLDLVDGSDNFEVSDIDIDSMF